MKESKSTTMLKPQSSSIFINKPSINDELLNNFIREQKLEKERMQKTGIISQLSIPRVVQTQL